MLKFSVIFMALLVTSCASVEKLSRDADQLSHARKIVQQHVSQVLTPDDVIEDGWADISLSDGLNFTHRIIAPTMGVDTKDEFRFVKTEDGYYIFDHYSDGVLQEHQRGYKDGFKYRIKEGQPLPLSGQQACGFFRIGICNFQIINRKKEIETSFNNGIWTQKWIYMGLTGIAKYHAVYDKRGIELYSWMTYENPLYPDFFTLYRVVERVK